MDNSIAGPSNYGVTEDVKSEFILGDPGETTDPTCASVDTSDLNSILDHLKVEEPQSEVGVIKNLVSFVEPTSVDKVVTVKQETQENELVAIKEELITDEEIDFKDLNVENCDPLKICLKDEKDDNIDLAGSSEEPAPDFKDEDFKDETTFSADPLIIDKQHDNEVNSPSSSSMLENLLVGKPSEMANKRNIQCRDGTGNLSLKGAAIPLAFSGNSQLYHFPVKDSQTSKRPVKQRKINKLKICDPSPLRNTHQNLSKGNKKTCKFCSKTFRTKGNLKQHSIVHADGKKLYSTNKNKEEQNVIGLSDGGCCDNDPDFLPSEESELTNKVPLGVDKAEYSRKPTNIHTGDIFCKCSDCVKCYKAFDSSGSKMIIQPKNTLAKARPICEICKHSFHRNAALNKHMRTVHKGNKQVCKICCRAFAKDYLPYHMKTQHSSAKSVQAFNCSMCDKSFTSKNGLNSHLKYIHNKVAQDLRGLYTCDVCGKQFNRKESLSNHKVQKHSLNKKEFICAHCDSKFEFRSTIISHMIHAHLPPTVKCNMCESLFHSKTTLNQHLVNEHSAGEPFVCETCGKTFGSKNLVNNHVKISHGDRKFKCQHCEKSFPRYRDLIQHAVVHSDVYNFSCELCDKSFKWKSNLKKHIKVHAQHEAKQFIATNKTNERFLDVQNDSPSTRNVHTGDIFCQCSDCVKGFKTLNTSGPNMRLQPMNTLTNARPICEICKHSFHRTSALNKHMRAVHKANRQVCKICCRAFSESYFAQHMKTQHSNVEPDQVHNCIKCDKSFKRKRLLDIHVRNVHVLKVSHSCDSCGKNFSSKRNLYRHRIDLHNVYKREFVCAHCDRKFKSRACISAHMNKLHLPPTHKCKMCDLLFRGSETLKRHLLVQHSVGKVQSFVCESCGKYFKQKYQLGYHMKTSHPVADKKFKCKHCDKSFYVKHLLQQHSLVHMDSRDFKCGFCEKSFKLKHHLKQHMAVHGLESTPEYRKKKSSRLSAS